MSLDLSDLFGHVCGYMRGFTENWRKTEGFRTHLDLTLWHLMICCVLLVKINVEFFLGINVSFKN